MIKLILPTIKLRRKKVECFGNFFTDNINELKPFIVVRDDGKPIHQFENFNEASKFSVKLNSSYKENGIKAFSKVINLSI
ncbi:hypothetical protein ACFLSE_08790 [Bacteroidota bacterium]